MILVDINPFGKTTDSILFDWEELKDNKGLYTPDYGIGVYKSDGCQMRYISSQTGVQPYQYSQYSLPIDFRSGNNLSQLYHIFQQQVKTGLVFSHLMNLF